MCPRFRAAFSGLSISETEGWQHSPIGRLCHGLSKRNNLYAASEGVVKEKRQLTVGLCMSMCSLEQVKTGNITDIGIFHASSMGTRERVIFGIGKSRQLEVLFLEQSRHCFAV